MLGKAYPSRSRTFGHRNSALRNAIFRLRHYGFTKLIIPELIRNPIHDGFGFIIRNVWLVYSNRNTIRHAVAFSHVVAGV